LIPALVTATPAHRTAERIAQQIAPARFGAARRVPVRREGVRRVIHAVVGCALLALISNAWLVQGLTAPAVVASGSMSPALLGPHRVWQCSACGHEFCCSAESLPSAESAALCSNCGVRQAAEQGMDYEGDRMLVDRATLLLRAPRRWETIVFRDPGQATSWCVKRVVGLPGEVVEIHCGDVIIDGRVAAKSLAELRTMAVNVYDASKADRRWQDTAGGTWQKGEAGALYRRPASDDSEIDWLAYRHEHGFNPGAMANESTILDESPVDQTESRALEPVADILLDCQLQAAGEGELWLRAGSTGDDFMASLDVTSGQGQLTHNERTLTTFTAGQNPLQAATRVEFVLADHRASLFLEGRMVAEQHYEPSAGPGMHVVAIGARGAAVEVRRLQILRDVHYTPGPPEGGSKHRLGPNEYYVLGDNSPHALDSRAESFGRGIAGDAIVGRAIRWRTHRKASTRQGSGGVSL
jgi:signal peptidase I